MNSQPFARVTPESVGVPSGVIEALVNNLERSGFEPHGLMLLRYGKVCAEGWWKPYAPGKLHNIHSYTKSFLATALGILVCEGKLSVEDKLISFFPDKLPAEPSENLRAMELRHLLSMNTGHHEEPQIRMEKDFAKAFLAVPVEHRPGSWFRYNSCASHMLGLVIHKVTGKTFIEVLRERVFEPMGFGRVECSNMADGFPSGGGGMAITTDDMARLAQLYLNRGKWNGEQLVPEEWIDAARVPHYDNSNGLHEAGREDWEAGYGYQLWMNEPLRSYRFDGAFGQIAMIYPDQQLAVILNSATTQTADMFRMISRFALGALSDSPLPENPGELAQLRERMASLRLPEVSPAGASYIESGVSGKKILLGGNAFTPIVTARLGAAPDLSRSGVAWIEPTFADGAATVKLQTKEALYTVKAGMSGEAISNVLPVDGEDTEFLASARWTDQNVLVIVLRQTPAVQTAILTMTYRLDSVEVRFDLHPRQAAMKATGKLV